MTRVVEGAVRRHARVYSCVHAFKSHGPQSCQFRRDNRVISVPPFDFLERHEPVNYSTPDSGETIERMRNLYLVQHIHRALRLEQFRIISNFCNNFRIISNFPTICHFCAPVIEQPSFIQIFVLSRQRISIHSLYTFTNIIKEMEFKWKFVSSTKYYDNYLTLVILYIFVRYVVRILCTFVCSTNA